MSFRTAGVVEPNSTQETMTDRHLGPLDMHTVIMPSHLLQQAWGDSEIQNIHALMHSLVMSRGKSVNIRI